VKTKRRGLYIVLGILALVVLFLVLLVVYPFLASVQQATVETRQEVYSPEINTEDFVSGIAHPYLSFVPGTTFVYEGLTDEGTERTVVIVTDEAKTVLGIAMTVVWDRVYLNGELIENTKDWYAQDTDGNVWYFGEDSKEIEDGVVVSSEGSWESGVDGALPGIVMQADPYVGQVYRQEYYAGEAEDMAEVISLEADVAVAYGSFSGCLQTRDWNPLEPGGEEYKYYCRDVGLVYEVPISGGEGVELISVETAL